MSESESPPLPRASVVTLPTEGRVVRAFGEEVRYLLTGAETGGELTQWIETTPPGVGPPPHYHEREDETFLVLEGRVEFFRNDVWTEVPVGTSVYMPRHEVHAFRNCGSTPLKMLISTMPSGFEVFFSRCAEVFAEPGEPDMARLLAISAEHGIHFMPPSDGH